MKKLLILAASVFPLILFCAGNVITPPKLVGHRGENYDESKTNLFPLPDILELPGEKGRIETPMQWEFCARPYVIEQLESQMYGAMPPRPAKMEFELLESSDDALGGIALRRQYKIKMADSAGVHSFGVLLYIPKSERPTPAIVCPNFCGNHTVTGEKQIFLPTCWMRNADYPTLKITNHKSDDSQRGKLSSRWPIEKIVKRGFAVACWYYCEIYPDKEKVSGMDGSIYEMFDEKSGFSDGPATVAWAWGNSRVLDLLESLKEIDSGKVAVTGHSRLGRTSILTAAYDKRFAMVLANNPGHMGAAISRRRFGESVKHITTLFPFWFSKNLNKYQDNEGELPIDQHQLLACVAPRALYVASASKDFWADPKGELMGLVEASKIYKLYGAKKLPTMECLEIEKPFIGDNIGYHLRDGVHNMTTYDWEQYLNFAESVFGKQQ